MSDIGFDLHLPILALLGYAFWAILLVLFVVTLRSAQVMAGAKKLTDFPSGQRHGSDFEWRANRAHANAVENLPIFAAVVLAGSVLEVPGDLFGLLAVAVLAFRILQSLIHLTSGTGVALMLRFSAYAVQLAAIVWMMGLCLQS